MIHKHWNLKLFYVIFAKIISLTDIGYNNIAYMSITHRRAQDFFAVLRMIIVRMMCLQNDLEQKVRNLIIDLNYKIVWSPKKYIYKFLDLKIDIIFSVVDNRIFLLKFRRHQDIIIYYVGAQYPKQFNKQTIFNNWTLRRYQRMDFLSRRENNLIKFKTL